MRSCVVFAVCALGACSSVPLPASSSRACEAPPTFKACSGLVIVTPREPIPASSVPPANVIVRDGEIESFQEPALLQRYAIDGSPPRLHATTDALMVPAAVDGTQTLTDGRNLFTVINGPDGATLRGWDDANAWLGDTQISGPLSGTPLVAAFDGLELVLNGSVSLLDSNGTVLSTRKSSRTGALIETTAYGCGFAYMSENNDATYALTTMPLDGRAEATQTTPYAEPRRWPWDPHALVATAKTDEPPACSTTVDLFFDDGRPSIHRELSTTCRFVNSQPAVLATSFGAILMTGDGSFVMLDQDANPIGSPVSLDIQGGEGAITPVAFGDYIAAITSELTSGDINYTYVETVLGCAP
jgi:hypothetical protein